MHVEAWLCTQLAFHVTNNCALQSTGIMVRNSLERHGCTLALVKTRWAFFIHAPIPFPASGVPSVMQTVRHIAHENLSAAGVGAGSK